MATVTIIVLILVGILIADPTILNPVARFLGWQNPDTLIPPLSKSAKAIEVRSNSFRVPHDGIIWFGKMKNAVDKVEV